METVLTFPYSFAGFLIAVIVVTVGHEVGHLLSARFFDVPVKLIAVGVGPTVWHKEFGDRRLELRALPLGMSVGVLGRRDAAGRRRRPLEHDIGVAAGGPLASIVLTLVLGGLAFGAGGIPELQSWLTMSAGVSIILAGLNLIPIPGLDGGHLLILTAARFGLRLSPRQEATVHRLGLQVAAVLCVLVFFASMAGVI